MCGQCRYQLRLCLASWLPQINADIIPHTKWPNAHLCHESSHWEEVGYSIHPGFCCFLSQPLTCDPPAQTTLPAPGFISINLEFTVQAIENWTAFQMPTSDIGIWMIISHTPVCWQSGRGDTWDKGGDRRWGRPMASGGQSEACFEMLAKVLFCAMYIFNFSFLFILFSFTA